MVKNFLKLCREIKMTRWGEKKCVIVDDNTTNREVAIEMLESLGIKVVHQSPSSYHALSEVFNKGIDLILLDWHMPAMDGLEFLDYVRGTAEGRKIVVIVYSAIEDGDSINIVMRSGADGFISKPITFEKLESELIRTGILSGSFKEAKVK